MTRVDFFQHLVVKEITVNVHVYSSDDFVPQNGMDQWYTVITRLHAFHQHQRNWQNHNETTRLMLRLCYIINATPYYHERNKQNTQLLENILNKTYFWRRSKFSIIYWDISLTNNHKARCVRHIWQEDCNLLLCKKFELSEMQWHNCIARANSLFRISKITWVWDMSKEIYLSMNQKEQKIEVRHNR